LEVPEVLEPVNAGQALAGVIDVQHWLPELVGKFQSQLGTATQTAVKANLFGCYIRL
jgi:hypothetical protein